jgi:alkylation response protein AidB-like acyl-CoA dehydrogenase
MTAGLDAQFAAWLDANAQALDCGGAESDSLLPLLAAQGLTKVGVPENVGGRGGNLVDVVAVVAGLAQHSLSAAFVYWAQRAVIECLLGSPNQQLVQRLLPVLLGGTLAGAPGLSNAMKSLAGLDRMHLQFVPGDGANALNGSVHWATNLRKSGFVVAAAAQNSRDGDVRVFAVPGDVEGVLREPDFDLLALRGTNTAAIRMAGVSLDDGWCLHPDAKVFLPIVRPALLAMQCGLGLGLARASMCSIGESVGLAPPVLIAEVHELQGAIDEYWLQLTTVIGDGGLHERVRELVCLRLRMVELALSAAQLELQALGGRAYVSGRADSFGRRWREVAFLPIVTPTALQLKTELIRLETSNTC